MSIVQWLFKIYNTSQNRDQAPELEGVWTLQAEEGTVLLGEFELQIQQGPRNDRKPWTAA